MPFADGDRVGLIGNADSIAAAQRLIVLELDAREAPHVAVDALPEARTV